MTRTFGITSMRVCVGGVVAIAALAVGGAATQAQTETAPLKLTLECVQAGEPTFRVTLQNVSTAPVVTAAVGAVFGSPEKHLPRSLRFTLRRAGVADNSFKYWDPALARVGGWPQPWVTLPPGVSHSMVVSVTREFRDLFSTPADVHVSLSTQDLGRLSDDAQRSRYSHVWVGTLTSDRIAFPNSCQAPS